MASWLGTVLPAAVISATEAAAKRRAEGERIRQFEDTKKLQYKQLEELAKTREMQYGDVTRGQIEDMLEMAGIKPKPIYKETGQFTEGKVPLPITTAMPTETEDIKPPDIPVQVPVMGRDVEAEKARRETKISGRLAEKVPAIVQQMTQTRAADLKVVGNAIYDARSGKWIPNPQQTTETPPSASLLPGPDYEWVPGVNANNQIAWQARLKGGAASGRMPNDLVAAGLMLPDMPRDYTKWDDKQWNRAEEQRRINRAMDAVGADSALRADIFRKHNGTWSPEAEAEFQTIRAQRARIVAQGGTMGTWDIRLGPQGPLPGVSPSGMPSAGQPPGVTPGGPSATTALEPGQSRIAREAEERQRGTLAGAPLSGASADKYAMYVRVENNIDFIMKNYRPEYVGKGFQPFLGTVKAEFDKAANSYEWDKAAQTWKLKPGGTALVAGGIAGGLRSFFGTGTDQEIQFRKTVADTANAILYAQSGAQINEQEYERLRAALFALTDEPATFVPGVRNFRRIVEQQIDATLGARTTSGRDILQERKAKRAQRDKEEAQGYVPPPVQGALPKADPMGIR